MMPLIKLLINFTIYLQFKELYSLLIQLPLTKGSHSTSVSLITPGLPMTQDTPGLSGTALLCYMNVLYERVDDVLVLIYSINVIWLYLYACIFSILEGSLFMSD